MKANTVKTHTYITRSASETRACGARMAKKLKGGDVVLLKGNLGAGKTQLAQGIAQGLGIAKILTSPTFTLMNVYRVSRTTCKGAMRLRSICNTAKTIGAAHRITHLAHIDLYRLKNLESALGVGVMDYIGDPATVTLIEWPEKIQSALPRVCAPIRIALKTMHKNTHAIVVSS